MLDKQPYGKGYKQKSGITRGCLFVSRKEGRAPRYDRASAPAAFFISPLRGIENLFLQSWVDVDPMILVRSVHQSLVSINILILQTYYIWMCHPSFPLYMPSLQGSLHISRDITVSPSNQLAQSWSIPRRPIKMN